MAKVNASESASDESIRAYLKETLEHLLAAGHSAHELVEFSIDKFGRKIIPHLSRLQEDIRQGRVQIKSLAEAAKAAVFGIHVDTAQREQMIREAAYRRAERRQFSSGGRDEDWFSSEREVDKLLEKQNGLLEKSLRNIESVSEIAKNELTEVKGVVRHWLKDRSAPAQRAG